MKSVSPVDPILRIPDVPIDVEMLVERARMKFDQFALDRVEWMRRREAYYLGWDDYVSPVRKGLWDGASNLHLPLTEVQVTVLHAMFMQAMMFNYPWFYVDPQQEVDLARLHKIELFMKYILERYVNFNKGIYTAMDDWCWDLASDGMAIFSRSWTTQQRKFLTVQKNQEFGAQQIDLLSLLKDTDEKEFDTLAKKLIKQPFIEKSIVRTIFNGPVVVAEDPAYVLFKGEVVDSTDLNEHATVVKVCYFDENKIRAFIESEYFDEEVGTRILNSPPDQMWSGNYMWGDVRVRRSKDIQTGVNTLNPHSKEKRWEFLCVYDTVSLNPNNKMQMSDRIQYFVHPRSGSLARWTYLDRISSSGRIPLHMAHLFRRPRRSIGRGMVQTMFALNEVQDILINQAIDSGMLANNPMFGYRGNSTFDPQEIRVEPGLGLKMDDPNADLRFFNWGINPNWSEPIQGAINSFAERLTAIGPQASGQVGSNVGPLRSTSGVQALGANASVQQNVLIQRAKLCVSDLFDGLYADCVEMMDPVLRVTVTGPDGAPVFDEQGLPASEQITQEELKMKVHFGIYANAGNMNPEMRKQAAMAVAQFSFTPIAIQTGVVQPQNVYAILENIHQSMGTLRPDRFLSKPQASQALPIDLELRTIIAGIMPPIPLNDPEHQAKIELYNQIKNAPETQLEIQYGHVAKNAMIILNEAIKLHTINLETMQKPSNVENPMGSNQSPTVQGGQGQPAQAQPKIQQPTSPQAGPAAEGQGPPGGMNG